MDDESHQAAEIGPNRAGASTPDKASATWTCNNSIGKSLTKGEQQVAAPLPLASPPPPPMPMLPAKGISGAQLGEQAAAAGVGTLKRLAQESSASGALPSNFLHWRPLEMDQRQRVRLWLESQTFRLSGEEADSPEAPRVQAGRLADGAPLVSGREAAVGLRGVSKRSVSFVGGFS